MGLILALVASPPARWALAAAGALIVAGGLAWAIYDAGGDAVRVEQLQTTLETVERARAVENRIDAAAGGELERLREQWTRP